jgi:hypothetical protein
MERGTADEMDASMLGVRIARDVPPCVKALRAVELLLHVVAWAGTAAAIVLDGHADGFDASTVLGEVRHYDLRSTTIDVVLVTVVAATIASLAALNRRPLLGLAVSVLACGACVAKRAMLLDVSSLRAACATCAVAATCCLVTATLSQAVRAWRGGPSSSLRLAPDDLEQTSGPGDDSGVLEAQLHINTGSSKGASVGRLLRLAAPERSILAVATVCLFFSTASNMVLPHGSHSARTPAAPSALSH